MAHIAPALNSKTQRAWSPIRCEAREMVSNPRFPHRGPPHQAQSKPQLEPEKKIPESTEMFPTKRCGDMRRLDSRLFCPCFTVLQMRCFPNSKGEGGSEPLQIIPRTCTSAQLIPAAGVTSSPPPAASARESLRQSDPGFAALMACTVLHTDITDTMQG